MKTLLNKSPYVKVVIVSFGSQIEVKGDCLSNVMIIKEKNMNNESKIKSIVEENTNLGKASVWILNDIERYYSVIFIKDNICYYLIHRNSKVYWITKIMEFSLMTLQKLV